MKKVSKINRPVLWVPVLSILLAAAPVFAEDAPKALDPVKDDGFENDVHKAHAGKIVFAKKRNILDLNKEKPKKFAKKFKITEPIHFRTYLDKSMENQFRAEGVKCHESARRHKIYKLSIDGKPIGKDGVLYHDNTKAESWNKWGTFRFGEALNGAVKANENSIQREFFNKAASELTPGKHTIKLTLTGKCSAANLGNKEYNLKKTVAEGEFTLVVDKQSLKRLVAKYGAKMPKTKRKDAKLVKQMMKIMKEEWPKDKILKTLIVDKNWTVHKDEHTKVILKRTIETAVAVRQESGQCQVFDVTFKQEANREQKYGPVVFGGVGNGSRIPCLNVK